MLLFLFFTFLINLLLFQGAAMAAYKTVAPDYNMEGPLSKSDARQTIKPKVKSTERNLRYQKWKMAIERSLNWETSSLSQGERESFDGA